MQLNTSENSNGECKGCFAYGGQGSCRALSEKPKRDICPFYKSKERIKREQTRTVIRLTSCGRTDLLEQYGQVEVYLNHN